MSKAVLISIRPKWCELIASGEKTIEVRKTRPNIGTPFKCYIYCTKASSILDEFYSTPEEPDLPWGEMGNQKVIGEFVCDNIKCIVPDCFVVKEDAERALLGSCLTPKQAKEYAGWKPGTWLSECKDLYGWHISDLVIYDKPRELSEFRGRKLVWRGNNHTHAYEEITKPPQSWCYVEELK